MLHCAEVGTGGLDGRRPPDGIGAGGSTGSEPGKGERGSPTDASGQNLSPTERSIGHGAR